MKRALLPCLFMTSLATFSQQTPSPSISTDQSRPAQSTLVIEANLSRTVYRQDEVINVRVSIRNDTDELLLFDMDPTNSEHGLLVLGSDGSKITPLQPCSAESFCSKRGFGLKPHSHGTLPIKLRDWFMIDKPGHYTLRYRATLPGASSPVTSNVVSFDIE